MMVRKDDEGGIERWYKLTDGLDMDREYVKSTKGIFLLLDFLLMHM